MNEIITTTNPGVIDLTGMEPEIITGPLPRTRNILKVAVPSLADVLLNKPSAPNYRDGGRKEITHYGNAITTNGFGTKELENYQGGVEDLIVDIGANFKVKPHSLQYINPLNGGTEQMPNYYLFNENTGTILNDTPVSDRYTVLDFDECIRYFYSIIEEIRKHGYEVTPDVARCYDNGNKMFLQYKITGGDILGEDISTRLTMFTSHDKSLSFVIALSQVRLICKNCVSRLLKNCDQQIRIRHTKTSHDQIEAQSQRVIASASNQQKLLGDYLENLATIKVNDQMIYDTWMKMNNIDTTELIPSASATKLVNRLGQYYACLDAEDLNDWRGTALGAYYAFSDFSDHVVAASDNRIRAALYDGNTDLGNFIDTLVAIAK